MTVPLLRNMLQGGTLNPAVQSRPLSPRLSREEWPGPVCPARCWQGEEEPCSCVSKTIVRDGRYTGQADKIGTVSSGFSPDTCFLFIWRTGGAACGLGCRGRTLQASYSFSSGFEKSVLFWLQLGFLLGKKEPQRSLYP